MSTIRHLSGVGVVLSSFVVAATAQAQPCGQWLRGQDLSAIRSERVIGFATRTSGPRPELWCAAQGVFTDEVRHLVDSQWVLDQPYANVRLTAAGVWNGEPVFGHFPDGQAGVGGVAIKTATGWNTSTILSFPIVRAFASLGSDLYAIGTDFGTGEWRGEVWRYDGVSWVMVALGNPGSEFFAGATYNGRLYIGGNFTSLAVSGGGFVNARNLARFDGAAWSGIPSSALNGRVTALHTHTFNALAPSGTQLVLSGDFTLAGGLNAQHIAAMTDPPFFGGSTTWAAFGAGLNGPASSMVTRGNGILNDLYVGGAFTDAGGVSGASGMAKWGSSNGSGWAGIAGAAPITQAAPVYVADHDGKIAIGGPGMRWMFGSRTNYVCGYDGRRVAMLGGGTDAEVFDLARSPDGQTMYAVGVFSMLESAAASHIAAKSLATPYAPWVALGAGTNGFTQTVCSDGASVYIGGQFTQAGTASARNIARWDGSTWHAMGTIGTPGGPGFFSGGVEQILMYDGHVTGVGISLNGTPGVAQWDGADWQPLGPAWPTSPYSVPSAACVYGGDLYIGGSLNLPDAGPCAVARFTGGTWAAVGTTQLPSQVLALTVHNGALHAAVVTPNSGEAAVYRLDGAAWTSLVGGDFPTTHVYDIRSIGGLLYAAGQGYFGSFDGSAWRRLNASSVQDVYAIEPCGNADRTICVGGSFEAIGPIWPSRNIARYSTVPVVAIQPRPLVTCGTTQPSSIQMSVGIDGIALDELTFVWRRNGVPIAPGPRIQGQGTPSLTITPAVASDSGTYDCVISNDCGEISTDPATVKLCGGDFNCSGTVTVQDIFDFLAAYFGGDPRADFDGSEVLSVQDLFDFLAAYFAGCP